MVIPPSLSVSKALHTYYHSLIRPNHYTDGWRLVLAGHIYVTKIDGYETGNKVV